MDVTADLAAPCSVETLFGWVDALDRYPRWLDIVARAEPDSSDNAASDGAANDSGPAWAVDLRGRLGPLARTKRLRMVRTVHQPPHRARFERVELDGRRHSAWVLQADVSASPGASVLTMHLHYGGSLWGSVLERMLGDEIERSRSRLLTCVSEEADPRHRG